MVVIFKPTLKCNITCKHCYVGVMRDAYIDMTIDNAISIIEKLPEKTEVILHGGEPALMGVDYYTAVTKNFHDKISFSIQTNLTLIDEKWIPFLSNITQGRVSTSYDYGSSLRPINKKDWVKRVKLLQRHNINPYVVSIFWKRNQSVDIREMIDFFQNIGTSFRLNYVENIGYASDNGFWSLRHNRFLYAAAIKNLFDMWFMNPNAKILVDPCAEIMSFFLVGGSVKKCPFSSKCYANIICINPNGDVFPCGGFDCFPGFRYGNLINEGYTDILQSDRYIEAGCRTLNLPEKCQNCDYFFVCEGGCRLEAFSYYGDINRETSMCDEYKEIFQHIEKKIGEEKGDINDWWMSLLSSRNGHIP